MDGTYCEQLRSIAALRHSEQNAFAGSVFVSSTGKKANFDEQLLFGETLLTFQKHSISISISISCLSGAR